MENSNISVEPMIVKTEIINNTEYSVIELGEEEYSLPSSLIEDLDAWNHEFTEGAILMARVPDCWFDNRRLYLFLHGSFYISVAHLISSLSTECLIHRRRYSCNHPAAINFWNLMFGRGYRNLRKFYS